MTVEKKNIASERSRGAERSIKSKQPIGNHSNADRSKMEIVSNKIEEERNREDSSRSKCVEIVEWGEKWFKRTLHGPCGGTGQ